MYGGMIGNLVTEILQPRTSRVLCDLSTEMD